MPVGKAGAAIPLNCEKNRSGCRVDMRPAAIIKRFDLHSPKFSKVSCYGHFGENAKDMPWEKTDLAEGWKMA